MVLIGLKIKLIEYGIMVLHILVGKLRVSKISWSYLQINYTNVELDNWS